MALRYSKCVCAEGGQDPWEVFSCRFVVLFQEKSGRISVLLSSCLTCWTMKKDEPLDISCGAITLFGDKRRHSELLQNCENEVFLEQ